MLIYRMGDADPAATPPVFLLIPLSPGLVCDYGYRLLGSIQPVAFVQHVVNRRYGSWGCGRWH
jgi:hypothetical protein